MAIRNGVSESLKTSQCYAKKAHDYEMLLRKNPDLETGFKAALFQVADNNLVGSVDATIMLYLSHDLKARRKPSSEVISANAGWGKLCLFDNSDKVSIEDVLALNDSCQYEIRLAMHGDTTEEFAKSFLDQYFLSSEYREAYALIKAKHPEEMPLLEPKFRDGKPIVSRREFERYYHEMKGYLVLLLQKTLEKRNQEHLI